MRAALAAGADAVHPGLRLPGRERRLRRGGDRRRAHLGRPVARGAPARRRQARGEADRARGRRARPCRRARPPRSATRSSSRLPPEAAGGGCASFAPRPSWTTRSQLPSARRRRRSATARCSASGISSGPRHVEAQLLGHAGGVAVLGARDCSIQRRHQKLIEESPAVGLDPTRLAEDRRRRRRVRGGDRLRGRRHGRVPRRRLRRLLPRAQRPDPGRAPGHRGGDRARHRRAAAPRRRRRAGRARRSRSRGHAIEARLYAEDPQSFLPQAGAIRRLVLPAGIRVDAGVEEGDEIGLSYDPLIAKLIALGADRDDAIARLELALDATVVEGVTTNLPFLRWLVRHPAFRAGSVSTAFLREHAPLSAAPLRPAPTAFAHAWRLNGPAPPPRPAPDVTATVPASASLGRATITAPMPGTVLAVAVAVGRRGHGARSARRPRGDEDGDARAGAVHGDRDGGARRSPATRSPRARCSSSSASAA